MNSTLTLNSSITPAISTNRVNSVAKSLTVSQIKRTLVHRWDMVAVIGLMASSAVYGVYAITQMTGF